MPPVHVLRAAVAALPLLAPGAATAVAVDGACSAGPDGVCAARGDALLQVGRGTAARTSHIGVAEEAGFCCLYTPGGCGQCGTQAPAGSWCATSQDSCRSCSGTWCGGGASGGAPPPAPTPVRSPTTAPPVWAGSAGAGALLWADEFDGGSVDRSKWSYRVGTNSANQELQYYTDRVANSQVSGGTLKVVARCDRYGGMGFTSARMMTSAAWGPGVRVDVRARLPDNRGTWPAIWMLPRDNAYGGWPRSGEIDIMESVGCDPSRAHGTVHTGAYNWMKGTQKSGSVGLDVTAWHVYSVQWTPPQITFLVDGSAYFSFAHQPGANSDQWPFDRKFYLILNNAVGGSWGGMCLHGPPSCSDPSQFAQPQVMEVDYARVFAI